MVAHHSCLTTKYFPFSSIESNRQRPAYRNLVKIGKHIQTVDKPSAIVAISAHWEGGRDSVEGAISICPEMLIQSER